MNATPNMVVQLIHTVGPLKGEMQEFNGHEILIGRHPDCQVRYPKKLGILSRKHARIVRDGQRFKLIDQSTNGTFVNGRQVSEVYLIEGDTIGFCNKGPKLKFLIQTRESTATGPRTPATPKSVPSPKPATPAKPEPEPPPDLPSWLDPAALKIPTPPPASSPPAKAAQAPAVAERPPQDMLNPMVVQFGPALKSFDSLPVTLGKGSHCDFVIDRPELSVQQAQIYYDQNQYWIKDLSGAQAVMIDGAPIDGAAALQPDMHLSISPQGPTFRYLGGGRLVEADAPRPREPEPKPETPQTPQKPSKSTRKFDSFVTKAGSLFKKSRSQPSKG